MVTTNGEIVKLKSYKYEFREEKQTTLEKGYLEIRHYDYQRDSDLIVHG